MHEGSGAEAGWRALPHGGVSRSLPGLLMLLAAPIFLSFDEAATWAEGYSPLTSLWSMAGDGLAAPTTGEWIAAGSPWVIAIVAWCLIAAAGSCDVGSKTGTSQT